MAESEWVGAKEAREILGISRARLYQLIDERKLTAYRTGATTRFRFRRQDLEELSRPEPVERRGKIAA